LVTIAEMEKPPLRFIAGADAIGSAEQKVRRCSSRSMRFRALSSSLDLDLDLDETEATGNRS